MYNKHKSDSLMKDYAHGQKLLGKSSCELLPLIELVGEHGNREIDYMYDNEDIDEIRKHNSFFKKTIPYVLEGEDDTRYTSPADMWKDQANSYVGYKCSSGKEKICIDWDGSCYTCSAAIISLVKPVFNINDPEFDPEKYFQNLQCVTCQYKMCINDHDFLKIRQPESSDHKPVEMHPSYGWKQYRDKLKP